MSIGERIAQALPDSALEYVEEHPRVLFALTVPLVAWCGYTLMRAVRLHVLAELLVAERIGEAQRAASEALGG